MNILYFDTMYPFFISLICIEGNNFYFLEGDLKKFSYKLKNSINVDIKSNIKMYRYLKIIYIRRKIQKCLGKYNFKKIYFQDNLRFSNFFLNNLNVEFHVIEDGIKNYNLKKIQNQLTKNKKKLYHTKLKNNILYKTRKNHLQLGLSDKIKKIYLTGILPIPETIKGKVEIIDIEI